MFSPGSSLLKTVTLVAAVVATTVALVLPAGYFLVGRGALAAHIQTRADLTAELLTTYISTNPELWMFETVRISEVIERRSPQLRNESIHLFDSAGGVVVTVGELQARFAMSRSVPVYDSGVAVARLEVRQSARDLALGTAIAAVIGLLLAAATYAALRIIPLRALRRATDDLRDEKERAEVTLHSIGDAVITTDAGAHVEYLNPVAEQLTGWSTAEAKGKPLDEIFVLVNELTQEPVQNPLQQAMATKTIIPLANHSALIRRDGKHIPIEDNAAPILDQHGEVLGGVLVFHDVSATRSLSTALSWQASHDALTDLINRAEFERRVERARITAAAENRSHVLCYIDLDQFKIVNDTCGHAAGDILLKQLTQLLQTRVRAADTLGRLGGDEFGLLIQSCPIDQGQRIASGLLDAFNNFRFSWDDKTFTVSASIGVVPITPSAGPVEKLMSDADAACYSAKEAGRNRIHVFRYQEAERAERRDQLNWVSTIMRALDDDRFTLYYQPYLTLTPGAADGARLELLVRMIGEKGEVIPPGAFIPAAERYKIMPAIDRWVITNVFKNAALLAGKFGNNSVCSINLSGQALSDEKFYDYIREQMNTHKVGSSMFCFEFTETAAVNELHRASQLISRVKALGFKFALDDFGSGMSSFNYLKNLPVDYLKIDGSFVRDIATNTVSRTMVSAMNQIAHAMGLATVAEFVDSEAALDILRTIGVDFAQGYLISKPMPLIQPDQTHVRPQAAGARL